MHFHRSLVKNLVLGYLHAPNPKKPEVLRLISKILGFTSEELHQVCVVCACVHACVSYRV